MLVDIFSIDHADSGTDYQLSSFFDVEKQGHIRSVTVRPTVSTAIFRQTAT
jgi:hypothetical protein